MEAKYSVNPSFFVTLTFDDNLVSDMSLTRELDRKYIHDFCKRIAARLKYNKIMDHFRYFGCGEYGDLGRAHYHLIVFDVPLSLPDFKVILDDSWRVGFVTIAPLSDARAMYVAKYTCKELFEDVFYSDKKQKPFATISTGSKKCRDNWIGHKFLDDKKLIERIKDEQLFYVRSDTGSVYNLPRAYRDRLFTKFERELHSDFLILRSEHPVMTYSQGLKRAYRLIEQNKFYETQFYKRLSDERKLARQAGLEC